MVKIAPSILSANFANLAEDIKLLDVAGADMIHFDVMDGCFVPNISFGAGVIKSVRPLTNLIFDVHLMINEPHDKITWFSEAGADIITIHAEACSDIIASLKKIRSLGCKAAISLNPSTSAETLIPLLDYLDMVLIMSVNPGFGGQKFMNEQLAKIRTVKKIIAGRDIVIEVDGGINKDTAPLAISAGADILVAGTAILNGDDYQANIKSLQNPTGEK